MSKYAVDRTKWQNLTIFEQMGNIYSEVGRTFNAKMLNDTEAASNAAARAFDLFDATGELLASQKSPKLSELLKVREIFVNEYESSETTTLDGYFMPFAIAARLRQIK